ncbi:nicotinate-nucleotide adenylyltransferase [Acidaminobacter sp. JC074]|uniref:nicotinate-nucleotide adenylyltransferase n=1 Tax=Acidaminobacter sp. JC074 TaxID=2530199 RepID=UPI001F0EF679|nr:nicotinate-nucleotide adenylyltransferase [Acidaminobacter sp. JC074]MCH4886668.1 nicotinate-nucleotide adenylyltransferase [Acidaminobacter sp. JC074]
MKIGLMGGSFDPIHNGHLVLAEQVRTRFQMDKIIFIPSGNPPHKETMASKEDRYNMTKLAIEDNEYFEISRIELDQDHKTYTIDTVKRLQAMYGDSVEVFFITGADMMIDLPSWKNFDELVTICKFIGSTRPGVDYTELSDQIDALVRDYKADITITQVPALAISSTDIRRRIKYNLSIRYLLPRTTEDYIYTHNLYCDRRTIL